MDDAQFLLILGSLSAVVGAASVAGDVLHWRFRSSRSVRLADSFAVLLLSRWTMLAVVAASPWTGVNVAVAFFAVVSVFALRMFMTAAGVAPGDDPHGRSDRLLHVAVILVQYALVTSRAYGLFSVCLPLVAALVLPVVAVCGGALRRPLECIAKRYWAITLWVYCLSCMPALLVLQLPGFAGDNAFLLLFLLVVAQAAGLGERVAQRLCGRHGRRRTSGRGTSAARCVGGAIAAAATGGSLFSLTPFAPLVACAVAMAVALLGFFGAAVMTAIRRDDAMRVRGRSLSVRPAVMEPLGALCFAAPVLLQFVRGFYG